MENAVNPEVDPGNYILKTKLFFPHIRKKHVERTRLLQQLRLGLNYRLILLSAPAGYGKSTLAASWAGECPYPIAWLSLDANDNTPARFVKYIAAAIQTALPTLECENPMAFHSFTPASIKSSLSCLVNQLCDWEDQFFLVLDDYQSINNKDVHELTAFLIEKMPENMHVIIASRVDPPFPLARLRASVQVLEIRTRDIQFNGEEIKDYFNKVMEMQLLQDDLAILEGCTEGWAAGLQMAALAMQSMDLHNNLLREQFLRSFQGSQRYIMDYLLEEVLSSQPVAIQRFLLHTSILDRLTAPLCDAILAGDAVQEACSSADTLAYLERANLFLVPLDDKRVWYRYHQLFADLLQNQLHQTLGTGGVARLHQCAAEWYEQNGLTLDAIHQASLAGDLEGVERLIERNYFELMNRGELSSMGLWTKKITKEQLYSRPKLCIYEAMSRLWFGQLDEADFLLNKAELNIRSLPAGVNKASLGFLTYVQSRLSALRGDMQQAIALNVQARQNAPADELAMRLTIGITLGMEYFLYGDFEHASEILQEVIEWAYTRNDISDGVAAYALLGRLYAVQGQLLKSHEQLQKAALWLDQSDRSLLGATSLIDLGFAAVLCERNDLDAALHYASKGLDRVPLWGKVDDLVLGYIVLARILAAQGSRAAAGEAVEKACQLVQACAVFSEARAAAEAAQVRLWLDVDNMQLAASWAATFDEKAVNMDDPFQFQVELACMTRARVYLAQIRWNRAVELLTCLEETACANSRMGRLIEILILKALALHHLGDTVQANRALEHALQLAAPQGYLRIFLDEGQPLQMLLAQWLAFAAPGPLRDYAAHLFSQFDERNPGTEKNILNQNLIEPLTPRELEVLHLIASGRTNQEIARQLIVSTGTIKAHAASIYRKLDVNNRTEAVAYARNLGILP